MDATSRLESTTIGDVPGFWEDPLIGQVVGDRYRICRTIGKGGMGVVYEAQHLLIGRKVALKTMAAHAAISPLSIERFRREAQAAASVGNSHIVDVLDMGQLDAGSFYIVLEHLDGTDLGFTIASSGHFTVQRGLHVIRQLCDALSAVHAAGIVHRDLKPDNLFLIQRDDDRDFVKVLDFGVCKFLDAPGAGLTASGDMVGTPLFMAPEQIEGRSSDHRTDIHALGAILFFVLTGRPPYEASSLPKLFVSICSQVPPSLRTYRPEISPALDAVVSRALDKDPARRFQSCEALKAALLSSCGSDDEFDATLVNCAVAPNRSSVSSDSSAALARALRSLRTRNARVIALGAAVALGLVMMLGVHVRSQLVGNAAAAATALPAEPEVTSARDSVPEVAAARVKTDALLAPLASESPRSARVRDTPALRPRLQAAPAAAPVPEAPSSETALTREVDEPVPLTPPPHSSANQKSSLNRELRHDL